MREIKFLYTDNSVVQEWILGVGDAGIVLEKYGFAIKIPRLSRPVEVDCNGVEFTRGLTPEPGEFDGRKEGVEAIEHEKSIYRRLGEHPSILPCYELGSTVDSIKMKLMKGDLRKYLAENGRPDARTQLAWMRDVARGLQHIHNRRVIIGDIRSANILLDHDFSVKISDFERSEMMPLDWDFQGIVGAGFSIAEDLGQFGGLMYEIITGQRCKFEWSCKSNGPGHVPEWPERGTLPSTEDVWLGHIMERCWTQDSLASAGDLVLLLEQERV